ncbi:hypothetical protein SESBI_23228 [Sesbania bispinosa]|nr:hypothetical protein SESBI_23228 [Sesbania bispinosa]
MAVHSSSCTTLRTPNNDACLTLGKNMYIGPHNVNGYIIHLRCRNLLQNHMMMSEKPGPSRRREQYQFDAVVFGGKCHTGPHHCPHTFTRIAAFVKDVDWLRAHERDKQSKLR